MDSSRYTWKTSNVTETGLKVIANISNETGIKAETVEFNSLVPYVSSLMAYSGAKISRQNIGLVELLTQINSMTKKNASQAIGGIVNYGHASVAEMSQLIVVLTGITDSIVTKFFANTSVGAGQQSSTRYIDFGGSGIVTLSSYFTLEELKTINSKHHKSYNSLNSLLTSYQQKSLELFNHWRDTLTFAYSKHFGVYEQLEGDDPKWAKNQRKSALSARVLDTARAFLTFGLYNRTTMFYLTNAREWASIIGRMRSSDDWIERYTGDQIFDLLAPQLELMGDVDYTPEAADLIKYASMDETTKTNFEKLDQWLIKNTESFHPDYFCTNQARFELDVVELSVSKSSTRFDPTVRLIALMILEVRPEWNFSKICSVVLCLNYELQIQLSDLLLLNYDCYNMVPGRFNTHSYSFDYDAPLSVYRDLNRHRAWTRYSPLVNGLSGDNIFQGFGLCIPMYLSHIQEFRDEFYDVFVDDLINLESQRLDLLNNLKNEVWMHNNIVKDTLLFATNSRFNMSAGIKEISYMTDRRERPGGHIDYRYLAYQTAKIHADSEPINAGLRLNRKGLNVLEPDPKNRYDFLDRS